MESATGTTVSIPKDAYLFFPAENEKFAGEGKKLIRWVFEGETTFEPFENQQLDSLYEEFKKQGMIGDGAETQSKALPDTWRRSDSLKFLIACSFDINKAIKGIQEYVEWRRATLPIELSPKILEYLNSGFLYMHGRDHRFRPLLVLNCYKIDPKTVDIDLLLLTMGYFLEYIIHNMLLPGQIERWVFIEDLKGMGITSIPFAALSKILSFLQNNFRSRLHKMYIMNSPTSLYFSWKMIKPLLEETTTAKINFSKDSTNADLWKHTNKSQVEQRFGGTATNIDQDYWPPKCPSEDYYIATDKPQEFLITADAYKAKNADGKLEKYRVSKELVE